VNFIVLAYVARDRPFCGRRCQEASRPRFPVHKVGPTPFLPVPNRPNPFQRRRCSANVRPKRCLCDNRRFCNGPPVNPAFCVIPSPASCFCPWSARSRHMMGSEDRPANLCRAVSLAVPRRRLRPDLIHRPGDGTSLQAVGVLCCLNPGCLLPTQPRVRQPCRPRTSLRRPAFYAARPRVCGPAPLWPCASRTARPTAPPSS
jgi:hypothetical protein